MVRLWWVLALALCGASQTVIRVDVDLVQVEAVVTDSHGRHISGLQPEDFQLMIDGKERTITHFSYVNTGKDVDAAPANGVVKREQIHRTMVFMVDEVHTSAEYLILLKPVMERFVKEQVSPGDLISVMATRSNMGIYERFTSDPRRLSAAMDRLVRLTGMNWDLINQVRPLADRPGLANASNAFFMETYHGLAMNALERAIAGLRDMPGRKAIVLFSDGIEFPVEQLTSRIGEHDPSVLFRMEARTRQVADMANRAGVVFYMFDSKQTFFDGPSPQRRLNMMNVPQFLAKETGGTFVHDTLKLSEALGKAMEDMNGYYLLGFKPAAGDVAKDREKLRVKVLRSGMSVRTRGGIGVTRPAVADAGASERQAMERALFSPFAAGEIGLRVTPMFAASDPDAKGVRKPLLSVHLEIDGATLHLRDRRTQLDVATVVLDANNKVVANQGQNVTVEVPRTSVGMLSYRMDVPVSKAGAYEVRAAVREMGLESAGSAGAFVEVPDFNQKRVTLSSVVLSDQEGGEPSGARVFAAGKRIYYGFRVYGAKAAPPKVELELQLYRGKKQVFASPPIPLNPQAGEKEITVLGNFLPPKDFELGDYNLKLVAYDRVGQADGWQWVDLTLR